MRNKIISAALTAYLAIGSPALAVTIFSPAPGTSVAALQATAVTGETTNVICYPDAGSSTGGFFAVEFIAGGVVVSLGVTDIECTLPGAAASTSTAPAVTPVAPVATPVSIVPPINPQYGAVADAGVEALISFPGFGASVGRAQEEVIFGRGFTDDEFQEILDTADREALEFDAAEAIRCADEIKNVQTIRTNGNGGKKVEVFDNAGNFLFFAEQTELEQAIDQRRECFDEGREGEVFFGGVSVFVNQAYAPQPQPSSGENAINEAINTPYRYSATLTPGQGGITGKFALSNPKAKRPWVLFFNSGVSGLDDDRTGADRRSRVWTFSAGGKIRLNRKTTFGITGGYRQGTVTSKANSSKLTGDYFSATISGDYLLMKALSLGLAATYVHGENTLAIGGGTGNFGVDVFNASASLSGAFKWQDFTIAPSFSAGLSRVNRDGYTDSLGIIVPGSEKTHGNVNFGTSISKTFRLIDGFKSITPSVSLGGGYFFRENFDATLTSGTVAKQLGFGANLATGLDLRMDNGIGLNFGGSYGLFQNDIQIWSFNAKLSKVF